MNKKLISILLSAMLLTGALAGCGGSDTPAASTPPQAQPPVTETQPAQTTQPANQDERTITDMAGREVTLPAQIETVATFGAIGVLNSFVELMGAGDRICNDMSPRFTSSGAWAMHYEFAPQIAGAPVFENADGEIEIETVLSVQPDLCVTMTLATAEYLAENGLNAVYLEWAVQEDIPVAVRLMGEVLGTDDIAEDYLQYFDEMVAKAESLTGDLADEDRRTVIYGNVVNFSQPHKIANWWIARAGGISVSEEAHTEESLTYTAEDLLLWNPEVMIVTASIEEELKSSEQLSGVTAVINDAIYPIPTVAHSWGNRTVEQPLTIMWAMNKMYPELYSETELHDDIFYFYEHFFHYEMSDEKIADIIG